ncbi:cation transporter [Brevundimonas bullata]|nr:cation transporter [Brevundimonas bullata]WQE37358.1 cation transporter [Brevundimonas bullata]
MSAASLKILDLPVLGMTCASCVGRVEKAIRAVPGVTEANVNLAAERATVRFLSGAVSFRDLAAAVQQAGYGLEHPEQGDADAGDREQAARAAEIRNLGRAVLIAGVATLPLFVLEMGSHFLPGMHHWLAETIDVQTWRLVSFVLTSFVLFVPGLLPSARRGQRHRPVARHHEQYPPEPGLGLRLQRPAHPGRGGRPLPGLRLHAVAHAGGRRHGPVQRQRRVERPAPARL